MAAYKWGWSSPLTKWGKPILQVTPPKLWDLWELACLPAAPGFYHITTSLTQHQSHFLAQESLSLPVSPSLLRRAWRAEVPRFFGGAKVFHLHSIMNLNDWVWVAGWFWENIMLKNVWLLTGDFGDLVICFHLFNFLVRFQEFFVAQPHLSNKIETPHDSPVSLTGKELKDCQMGLLHTRPGGSWKNGGNMLETWLPGMAWCFTVQIYSPKFYTAYIYIYVYQDLKKMSTTRAQCCRFVSPRNKLEQLCVFTISFTAWWIFSRRLGRTVDLLSESERFMSWGRSTSSWFVDFGMQKPFQEPGISWKKRETSILLFQQCIK